MKFRIKYADQVVGSFVLIALLAMGGTLIFIGMNQRWFAKNYHFRSEFASASNLDPGMSIHLKGFVIGKISKVRINSSNLIDVDFYIYDTYYDKVKEFSVLELSVSPIGLGTSLVFHPGRGSLVLPEGSFVYRADSEIGQTVVAMDLVDIPVKDDTITRLFSSLTPLLENANKTIVGANKTISELNMAIRGEGTGSIAVAMRGIERTLLSVGEDVPPIIREVDSTLKSVNEIAAKVDGITDDLKKLTAALAEPGGAVDALIDPKGSIRTLLDDDNALFNRVNTLLDQINSTLANVDSISRRINNEMPGLSVMLSEGKTTLVKAQDVLEGLKNNPLLKGGIPERKSQDTLFRSMRDEEF